MNQPNGRYNPQRALSAAMGAANPAKILPNPSKMLPRYQPPDLNNTLKAVAAGLQTGAEYEDDSDDEDKENL